MVRFGALNEEDDNDRGQAPDASPKSMVDFDSGGGVSNPTLSPGACEAIPVVGAPGGPAGRKVAPSKESVELFANDERRGRLPSLAESRSLYRSSIAIMGRTTGDTKVSHAAPRKRTPRQARARLY